MVDSQLFTLQTGHVSIAVNFQLLVNSRGCNKIDI